LGSSVERLADPDVEWVPQTWAGEPEALITGSNGSIIVYGLICGLELL